ncbi:rRNA-processing arch domain-containing protein [Ditylenchus destructor]|uniref:rRNA-processing arch domain-containing protein n=1 Tax=Ditylenchus destructor TaxID=166010 RepID=A0AAD4N0Z9_9BILA|nr:rRNA-processing arch domain-containing protein [Ditylenchus destructor]
MADLFGAFDDDDEMEVEQKPVIEQIAVDKMAELETRKKNQAHENTEDLISRLSSGTQKRQATDGAAPAAKISRRDATTDDVHVKEEPQDDEEGFAFDKIPRIVVTTIANLPNCNHEVACPPDAPYQPLVERVGPPAKEYPFELDTFQVQSIKCVENNQSVLVSAHTSAGKTVVALYAIAMALRDKQRVIYTSPIKALSNQKYRELSEEFPDVGLVTGDVTLNPNASCVVMTTEILRSMLYRGTEIMREVGWVIFDEIHYMRDKERGVVWEEAIILLPDNVHYVFLSATIPNAQQFAEWISYLHHQPCHVVYTDYRPVPLQHFIYSAGSDGLYEVVDVKGNFREDQFTKAMSFLADGPKFDKRKSGGGPGGQSNVVKIIRTIKERDMLPCIIFSFSRKECEAYASILKDMDFNDDEEKRAIKMIYENAISLLSTEDQTLPQIATLVPYLLRGIGIHHSGLLPILKEIVEILFGEGLIKTLFATETFAMGLNMPAKTVLFTSARKFDGVDNRWISSGEYIQMSGRAGRRGKDDRGLVIMMVDQAMSADVAKQVIKGTSDRLDSQFRLTYNMVLNLLRVPEINPEFMMEKSFFQFQNYTSLPTFHQELKDAKQRLERCHVDRLLEVQGYHTLEKTIESLRQSIRDRVLKPRHVVPYLNPGRVIRIKWQNIDFGWGVLLSYKKQPNPLNPMSGELLYVLDVMIPLCQESVKHMDKPERMRPPKPGEKAFMEMKAFTFECVTAVSTVRLKMPEELKSYEAKASLNKILESSIDKFAGVLPEVDPIDHMKIQDPALKKEVDNLRSCEERFKQHPIAKRPDFKEIYKSFENKLALEEEYKQKKERFKKAKSLLQEEELGCRKRVLRRLQYCDENDIITVKGRVACELSSADELLLTEMIFTAAFTDLSPEAAAALLSCFVFQERGSITKMSDELSGYLRNLQNHARKIAKIVAEAKLEIDEERYVESFGPQMMDVVYKWCSGATFSDVVKDTDIFEGSIIRCMRRLELVLNEMVNAAQSYGDKSLEEKFQKAIELLKRDIVFSASLYL